MRIVRVHPVRMRERNTGVRPKYATAREYLLSSLYSPYECDWMRKYACIREAYVVIEVIGTRFKIDCYVPTFCPRSGLTKEGEMGRPLDPCGGLWGRGVFFTGSAGMPQAGGGIHGI